MKTSDCSNIAMYEGFLNILSQKLCPKNYQKFESKHPKKQRKIKCAFFVTIIFLRKIAISVESV